jgi:hypothetical protein
MLEEAGGEDLACIRATMRCTQTELENAITGLKRLGYVVDDLDSLARPALSLTKAGRKALTA